jgi:hypothetical protein
MRQESITIDAEKMADDRIRVTEVPEHLRRPSLSASARDGLRPSLNAASRYTFQEDPVGYDANANTRESLGCMYERIWSVKALLR